jgi:NAD(P)H dehydrogenase (quinone)
VAAGVGHVVLMSAAGTRRAEEPAIGASYWNGEQRLIATAPAWTILRMNYYAEALAQEAQMSLGMGALTGLAENRVAFVSRDDVAAAAAGCWPPRATRARSTTSPGPNACRGPNGRPSSPRSPASPWASSPSPRRSCAAAWRRWACPRTW